MIVLKALVWKNKSDKNFKKKKNDDEEENKNQIDRKPWKNKNTNKNDTSGKKIITNIIMIITIKIWLIIIIMTIQIKIRIVM